MASLGDISRAGTSTVVSAYYPSIWATGKDYGAIKIALGHRGSYGIFTGAGPSATNVAVVPASGIVLLLEADTGVQIAMSYGASEAKFYDLYDGEYLAFSPVAMDSWTVVVSGGVPVVTLIDPGGTGDAGTRAYGFVMA